MDRRARQVVVAHGFDAALVGGDKTCPHGFDGRDDHRANQDEGHRAVLGVEQTDAAFVAGEQARHVAGRQRVDREQAARHVHGFTQGAGPGHVHAVVVARRQIDGGI
ncbi:hypothetical protein G6F64_014257 [Rhizopus arrhizus]|uniref:Uncharacterized protein n=1 Tax=Rhizopus oryzae TaxID=64495 RepID=A0A9P6WTR3_RHIOR|nr:hypothetical protein G6F64_014257 [Rhizopus arrhizus]